MAPKTDWKQEVPKAVEQLAEKRYVCLGKIGRAEHDRLQTWCSLELRDKHKFRVLRIRGELYISLPEVSRTEISVPPKAQRVLEQYKASGNNLRLTAKKVRLSRQRVHQIVQQHGQKEEVVNG